MIDAMRQKMVNCETVLSDSVGKFFKFIDFFKNVEDLMHNVSQMKDLDSAKHELETFIHVQNRNISMEDMGLDRIQKMKGELIVLANDSNQLK